jgi:hypothetical protein
MKSILFVTYGGGHSRIIIKLIKSGYFDGFKITILALNNAIKDFQEARISFFTLYDFIHLFKDYSRSINYYKEIIRLKFYKSSENVTYSNIELYLALGFIDSEINGKNPVDIIKKFMINGKNSLVPINIMKLIIQDLEPNLVIVTCGVRYEKAAVIASSLLKVPNLRIDDILGEDRYVNTKFSFFSVVNSIGKKNLVKKLGKSFSRKIFITGNPNLSLKSYNNIRKNEFLYDLAFFTQPDFLETKLIIDKLISISYTNKLRLIIKIHPSENMIDYKEFLYNKNFLVSKTIDSNQILINSKLILTINSTIGLQAVLNNKDLILIRLSKFVKANIKYSADLSKYKIAKKVSDIHHLEKNIDLFLKNRPSIRLLRHLRKSFRSPKNPEKLIFDIVNKIIKIHEK